MAITAPYHHVSFKHLQRYLTEFAARQSLQELGTVDQMVMLVRGMEHKRLMWVDLTGKETV